MVMMMSVLGAGSAQWGQAASCWQSLWKWCSAGHCAKRPWNDTLIQRKLACNFKGDLHGCKKRRKWGSSYA